ncbi:MAG TPA: hypothetical protein VFC72_06195 [Corynebacterium sp.]|nr:hypothetical protein [Corynebacterium sp.]
MVYDINDHGLVILVRHLGHRTEISRNLCGPAKYRVILLSWLP